MLCNEGDPLAGPLQGSQSASSANTEAESHSPRAARACLCRVLNEVEDLLRSQELLPTEPAAAAEALLRRASILLACGKHVSGWLGRILLSGCTRQPVWRGRSWVNEG